MKTIHFFLIRLKLAWWILCNKKGRYSRRLTPYHYYCRLVKDAGVCDNNRRKSRCESNATIALSRTVVTFEQGEHEFYHVCEECYEKFVGTTDGDSFNTYF